MTDIRTMNATEYASARRAAIKGVAPPPAAPANEPAPAVRIGTSDTTAPPPKPGDTAPTRATNMTATEFEAAKRVHIRGGRA